MKNIFNSKLICIAERSLVAEAKELMTEKRIRHLPVVNGENEIISILSRSDMIEAEQFQDSPIKEFASSPVYFVTSEAPLSSVASMMLDKKISSVLLCNSDYEAIGIITTEDILLQFSNLMKQVEKKQEGEINQLDWVVGAGEFFRRLSEIGI